MYITLPKGINIDTYNVPDDFELMVQEAFAKYTEGTNPKFMYEDKLCFIDLMANYLHHQDAKEKVNARIISEFSYELTEYGEYTEESEFLTREFMEDCYEMGVDDAQLYSRDFSQHDKYENEKIMRILCRAIKAVMDYEWGNDGI